MDHEMLLVALRMALDELAKILQEKSEGNNILEIRKNILKGLYKPRGKKEGLEFNLCSNTYKHYSDFHSIYFSMGSSCSIPSSFLIPC